MGGPPANLVAMRLVLVIAASALVAACSSGPAGSPESSPTSSAPSSSPTTATTTPTSPQPPPAAAPAAGAAIADVIAWVEAGAPADPAGFHSMTRDGEATSLGDGVAFITAGTAANCVTDQYQDGALACLLKLTNPPPRPSDVEGEWKGNWVDFPGTTVDVGSAHGDPGPFGNGIGVELPAGRTLAFGDYRCRADADAALFCVDYAHRSAVEMSATGVEGFGCLKTVSPPAGIGRRLSC